jgi:quinone-reactive Ni/Fe-hydrogenase large subunit
MKKIVIDPVTRIEGHLRVEVVVDEENVVQDAFVSGQLFRGIETILKGRDPRDAGLLAGRICGVCTNSHFRAAVSCVENAYGLEIPQNARIIRELMALALFLQDHVVHFYHLQSLDYVDVTKALEADPYLAAKVAQKYCDEPYRNAVAHYEQVLKKIGNFVNAGKLGPFAKAYWGHSDYRLTPEENLILLSHYLEALTFQTNISKAVAIFGGKTPHPQSIVVGGITSAMDMLNPVRINEYLFIIKEAKAFIDRAYLPDMKLLVSRYKEEIKSGSGRGNGNFLSVGGFELSEGRLFESGVIFGHDLEKVSTFDATQITEHVDRAWYETHSPQTPYYTDLHKDGTLKTENDTDKYSWIKAPRYRGETMECGPLARLLVSYAKKNPLVTPYVDTFLETTDLEPMDLSTTLGRNAARAIETQYIAEYLFRFVSDLLQNLTYYDTQTWESYVFEALPSSAKGESFFEVPRGILSHFVQVEEKKIARYSVIAPTTWNATPRNSDGVRGAYEEALIGIHIADTTQPLEVLKVIRSFDPCLACAVHVIDAGGKALGDYRVT